MLKLFAIAAVLIVATASNAGAQHRGEPGFAGPSTRG
jgi:hypothetical protein